MTKALICYNHTTVSAHKYHGRESYAADILVGDIDESALTKGHLRKLNALRKSVGEDIGERAFAEWLSRPATARASDRNAELIAESLWSLVEQGKLAIRSEAAMWSNVSGRGRIIVEPAKKT